IVFVEELEEFLVEKIGKQIRFHSFFGPSGVNANFIKIMPDGAIRIRTYERGVEGETLSCGTGAAAAAFVVSRKKNSATPIRVIPKSGECLEFSFEDSSLAKNMYMLGPASRVFEGRLEI
ncbi:MAG: diaminopimelate epimerase, partial [Verrucomicrobia bacterium]|nr:diaminopimelate epimerase [Verrucomicrobiota bacterium]